MSSLRDCSHGWIALTTKDKYKLSQCLTTQPPLTQRKEYFTNKQLQAPAVQPHRVATFLTRVRDQRRTTRVLVLLIDSFMHFLWVPSFLLFCHGALFPPPAKSVLVIFMSPSIDVSLNLSAHRPVREDLQI